MEWLGWIAVIALALVLLSALVWRPRMRRPRTPEEAVEMLALKAEQDRTRTSAIEGADRGRAGRP